MAILNIVKDGDEILRKKSKKIETVDEKILTLIDDMKETMEKAGGVGLAAVQIGKLKQVIVINTGEDELVLLNPVMLKKSGSQEDLEGCLSCPNRWGITKRPMKVEVETLNLEGEKVRVKAEGFLAKAICHEMDHLEGKLFYDEAVRMLTQEEIESL
ncbi:MAG: peptide deformylase [Clostridia bacterium]|nr:peptide deformylase [Clostridia bacterium]